MSWILNFYFIWATLILQFIPGQVRKNSPLVKFIKTAQVSNSILQAKKYVNLKFTGEPTCQVEKNGQIHASSSFLQQPRRAPSW